MSFYGVEWDLTVNAYRFAVGYDRDAPCGLNQRTVYVYERIPIQRVPLESVSGRCLLDAYLGANRDTRQHAARRHLTRSSMTLFGPGVAQRSGSSRRVRKEERPAPDSPPGAGW